MILNVSSDGLDESLIAVISWVSESALSACSQLSYIADHILSLSLCQVRFPSCREYSQLPAAARLAFSGKLLPWLPCTNNKQQRQLTEFINPAHFLDEARHSILKLYLLLLLSLSFRDCTVHIHYGESCRQSGAA